MLDWLESLFSGDAVLQIVLQIVDFLYKAVIAYAQTPEGQKEFEDIATAVERAASEQGVNPRSQVHVTGDTAVQPNAPSKEQARAAAGMK